MQQMPVTRMELLARKTQLQHAYEGRELLDQKRNALMQELMRTVTLVVKEADDLDAILQNAQQAIARAEIEAGTETVQSTALASISELPLEIESTRKMGVEILRFVQPQVLRSIIGRGYALTNTPLVIDEAASAFEAAIEFIVQQAENELRLIRLAQEIQRTVRRVNILDYVIVPRLKKQILFIEKSLNERTRSDDFRFRLSKRLLYRKRTMTGSPNENSQI